MRALFVGSLLFCTVLCACHQDSREESFAKAARELTKQCPQKIDEYTSLDSLVYNRGTSSYHYFYSLRGVNEDATKMMIDRSSFAEEIKNGIVNSVEMKPQKEAGLTFVYHYYSGTSHQELGKVVVMPDEYNR